MLTPKMNYKRATEIIFAVWRCIDKNDGISCDRNCEKCDLKVSAGDVRDAFNFALMALDQVPEILTAVDLIRQYRDEYDMASPDEMERNLFYAYERCYFTVRHLVDEYESEGGE